MNVSIGRFVSYVFLLALFPVCSVSAAEWHVFSDTRDGMTGNQQLTNAFAKAVKGDTITIHAGTYTLTLDDMMFRYETDANGTLAENGTCLYTTVDDLTIQGDPSVSRSEIVLNGSDEYAIMRLDGSSCTVKHLTFSKGRANYNTSVFRNGSQLNKADTWIFRRGGGICLSGKSSTIEDCRFLECYAGQGAAVYGVKKILNCSFEQGNAVASNAGCTVCDVIDIYDSSFSGNKRGCVRSHSGVMSNCVFTANTHNGAHGLLYYQTGSVVDCVFSNNTTVAVYLHGAKYMPKEIRGCSFIDNSDSPYSAGIGGSVPCTTQVTNCLFQGDMQLSNCTAKVVGCRFLSGTSKPMIAACPNVEDSVFEGNGKTYTGAQGANIHAIADSSFKRCRFENLELHWAYGFLNVHRMENCLITGCSQWGAGGGGALFGHTDGLDANYVNCTVATNGAMNYMFVNTTGTGTITFKNTLFAQNKVGGQAYGAFDIYEDPNNSEACSTLKMDHSIFKAGNNSGALDISCVGCSNLLGTVMNPMFLKDGYSGTGEPFSLSRKSTFINAGDNGTWTVTDIDLAGNPRIRTNDGVGRVDIGCYENYDVEIGTCVILR